MRTDKLVYVCSPLRGNIEENLENAKSYSKYVMKSGYIPFTPHLYFTTFLDDNIEEERTAGMQMGMEMLEKCDELWVMTNNISEGMAKEIEWWIENKSKTTLYHMDLLYLRDIEGGLELSKK